MRKVLILSVLAISIIGFGGWYWRSSTKSTSIQVQETKPLSKGSVISVLEATGIIKPEVGAIVKTGSRATGLIKRMYVRVGDRVSKGDLIAEIDDREQQASLAESKAALAKAKADLDKTQTVFPLQINEARAQQKATQAEVDYLKLTLSRKKSLVKKKLDSQDSLDDAKQQYEIARNTLKAREATLQRLEKEYQHESIKAREAVAAAQADLDSTEVQITYTTIHAPIDGVVSQVAAQEGETVVAGLEVANLITILDPVRLEMWIYVDETDVGQITPGMNVDFRVDAYPNKTFTGNVDQIYPQPEIRDNIVYYQALVRISPETAKQLRPEMTTQCSIVVSKRDNVLALPNEALKWVNGKQLVYVQRPDGNVDAVDAKLGLQGQTHSEVISGLQEGDNVATRIILPAKGKKGKRK